jgi:hypothetical protein
MDALDKGPKRENMDIRYGKRNESRELDTGFLCIRETYRQLRGLSLLVIG